MAVESHHEIIDEMIKYDDNCKDDRHPNIISQMCRDLGGSLMYSITNYAVLCDDKIVCFTGSDIMDAANICDYLEKKFPGKHFYHSEEFLSIEV